MSVSLKQFAGSTVTPSDDAISTICCMAEAELLPGIEATHAGTNQLAISAGWGVVYGRVFYSRSAKHRRYPYRRRSRKLKLSSIFLPKLRLFLKEKRRRRFPP